MQLAKNILWIQFKLEVRGTPTSFFLNSEM